MEENYYIDNDKQLNVGKSVMFCRLHDSGPRFRSDKGLDSVVRLMIGDCCKVFANDHPDFPDNEDLLEINKIFYRKDFDELSHDDFERFLEHFETLIEPLSEWVAADDRDDIEATCLLGSFLVLADDPRANVFLFGALVGTLKGQPFGKSYSNLWMMAGIRSDFEEWMKENKGVCMLGRSPYFGMDENGNPLDSSSNSGSSNGSSTNYAGSNPKSGSGGGCYVATAVYGSYDCPQVWTLRRFRDNTLAGSWYGRLFIRLYYAVSPTIVKWFGNTAWFKKMWRTRLDKMVERLQAQGVESTRYEDRVW